METPEHLIQDRVPKVNDLISFYNERLNTWVDAKITHDLSRKWNRYYNIQYLDGERDGLFLKPDTRWTFLQTVAGEQYPRGLLRNGSKPSSMNPSPASPIPRIQEKTLDSTSIHSVASSLSVPHSTSSHDTLIGLLDRRAESMEWDLSYLELESTQSSQHCFTECRHINLNDVNNLNRRLPLTSSPVPPRRRLQHFRQALPLELETRRPFLPEFLQKFNPFKKRDQEPKA